MLCSSHPKLQFKQLNNVRPLDNHANQLNGNSFRYHPKHTSDGSQNTLTADQLRATQLNPNNSLSMNHRQFQAKQTPDSSYNKLAADQLRARQLNPSNPLYREPKK